ncbi:MAG: hypothetical protein KatS3mg058_3890 [Roseiflexus sp.]|nr:MAG: hypothetical protein KatS3mg058_3890 [Roseiflexus sp.]
MGAHTSVQAMYGYPHRVTNRQGNAGYPGDHYEDNSSYQFPVTIRHGHPEPREGSCATRADSALRLP